MNTELKPMMQGSPDWLAYRQGKRNSSESAAVLGISPWYPKTHKELARLKRGIGTMPDNPAMAYGRAHEAEARAAVENATGSIFEPAVTVDGDYSASLDGITLDCETLLEIKCPSPTSQTVTDARRGIIPSHYYAQVIHQLGVSRAKRCIFAVWTEGELIRLTIEPSPEYWGIIRAAWDKFWPLMSVPECELSDYIRRDDDEWRDAAAYYRAAHADAERAGKSEADAKARLVKLADKRPSEGFGVRVMRTLRAGAVDYTRVPQLAGVDLEPYRKRATEYWQVRGVDSNGK